MGEIGIRGKVLLARRVVNSHFAKNGVFQGLRSLSLAGQSFAGLISANRIQGVNSGRQFENIWPRDAVLTGNIVTIGRVYRANRLTPNLVLNSLEFTRNNRLTVDGIEITLRQPIRQRISPCRSVFSVFLAFAVLLATV